MQITHARKLIHASVHQLDWLKTGCIDITENKPSYLHSIQVLIFHIWLSEGVQVVYVTGV